MPFFARPDLSNEQFKQLSGSTLTLSGTTQIANPVGGLEFIDDWNTNPCNSYWLVIKKF